MSEIRIMAMSTPVLNPSPSSGQKEKKQEQINKAEEQARTYQRLGKLSVPRAATSLQIGELKIHYDSKSHSTLNLDIRTYYNTFTQGIQSLSTSLPNISKGWLIHVNSFLGCWMCCHPDLRSKQTCHPSRQCQESLARPQERPNQTSCNHCSNVFVQKYTNLVNTT